MRLTEHDLERVTELKNLHKSFKDIDTDTFINDYLKRCELCGELTFQDELKPIISTDGKVYQMCDSCEEETLEEMRTEDPDYEMYKAEEYHELKTLGMLDDGEY